ncbi:(Na+)-NQR maturation NqrM [Alkalisalibacterium limincola]|uniref:(Na+)-NQR maturation NqrM n=1 Tax=Alkalisalibacterium limincola TaxID=2699169 RepID=A0A5C8KUR1_9GAMM|nr:(Na+)-NQR maturation NqrM [Alkalisalibacterium limincola]TXK64971.1 (Na+)-NQR maturation NqrM [Alkalisalibacterium limincola]
MLMTFLAAIVLVGLLFAGMTIGVMMGRKPVQGSCGGLGSVGVTGDCGMCGRKAGEACAKGESLPDDGARNERR